MEGLAGEIELCGLGSKGIDNLVLTKQYVSRQSSSFRYLFFTFHALAAFAFNIASCLADPGKDFLTYSFFHFFIDLLNLDLEISHHRHVLVPQLLNHSILAAHDPLLSGIPNAIRPA